MTLVLLSHTIVRAVRVSRARAPGRDQRPSHQGRAGVCRVIPDMPAPPPNAVHTPVHVVETSLGIVDDVRLLRHLGLRFGSEESFVEAHFGPSDAGSFHEGFLKFGEGQVAESEYLDEFPAGAIHSSTACAPEHQRSLSHGVSSGIQIRSTA